MKNASLAGATASDGERWTFGRRRPHAPPVCPPQVVPGRSRHSIRPSAPASNDRLDRPAADREGVAYLIGDATMITTPAASASTPSTSVATSMIGHLNLPLMPPKNSTVAKMIVNRR
jgi:hypothetical protein